MPGYGDNSWWLPSCITVFIQIDSHALIDAHPPSSASSFHTKVGGIDNFFFENASRDVLFAIILFSGDVFAILGLWFYPNQVSCSCPVGVYLNEYVLEWLCIESNLPIVTRFATNQAWLLHELDCKLNWLFCMHWTCIILILVWDSRLYLTVWFCGAKFPTCSECIFYELFSTEICP